MNKSESINELLKAITYARRYNLIDNKAVSLAGGGKNVIYLQYKNEE